MSPIRHATAITLIFLTAGLLRAEATATAPAETKPAADAAASQPAAETASRPEPISEAKAVSPDKPKLAKSAEPEANIRFQFNGVPYRSVVQRFAQMLGKPLIGDLPVEGTLTFFDSQPYTRDEAMDTMNILLSMRGFTLMETDRFLRVVPLSQVQQMPLKILKGLDKTEGVRPGEIVTVVLPLKYINANDAAKAVVRMVSSYGSVSPMVKGKGIVITDSLRSIQRVRQLLGEMDTDELVDEQLKTYPVQHASAKTVAEMLNRLFAGKGGSRYYDRNQKRWVYTGDTGGIKASADERTNMVIASGPSDRLALAEQMIAKLDAKEVPGNTELRVFALENARAESVAKTVRDGLPGTMVKRGNRQVRVTEARIVADADTNRLVVSAPVDQFASIEKLINDLDAAAKESGGARVFRLKHADAGQLMSVISAAVATRDAKGRVQSYVNVTSDPRTNRLIVAGSAGDIRTAASLIEQFDQELPAQETREIHVVQLEAGSARDVARSLVSLFQKEVRDPQGRRRQESTLKVEAEGATNSLMISASPQDWPRVQKLLETLQASVEVSATAVTRIVPLQHARPEELAQALRQIYDPRRRQRRGQPEQTPITIVPSQRSSSLIVSAAPEDQEVLARLIVALDIPSDEKVEPIRIVDLESADAEEVAQKLDRMFQPTRRGEPRDVIIQFDKRTNSLLVLAPESKRKVIEQTIAQLDKATQQRTQETRLLHLEHTSASALAETLSRLYGLQQPDRRGRRRAPEQPRDILITPAPGDRTLLVKAPREEMEQIAQLVETMDSKEAPGATQIRTYELTNARAEELARSLAQLFRQQRGRGTTGEPEPRFEANTATNQLLVSATAGQFEEIDRLVEKVKTATILASQTKTFRLKHAKASEIAEVLNRMLPDTPTAGRGRRNTATDTVRIAPMEAANAVIVQGPPEKLTLADELIRGFDTPDAAGATSVHIVRLENAKAESLARTLQSMIPQPPRGQVREVFVEPDAMTNSILLRAPASQRTMLEEMIAQLDQQTAEQAREMRIIPLKHAAASSLAEMLGQLYGSDVNKRRRWWEKPQDQAADRVSITAAPNDKLLVVEAPRKAMEQIAALIESLDQETATNVIQVRTYKLPDTSKAVDVARSLGRLFRTQARSARDAKEPEARFEAEATANQLLVAATADQFQEIEKLIETLQETPRLAVQTKTYRLQFAKADELIKVISPMLGIDDRSARGRGQVEQAPLQVASLSSANAIVIQGAPEKLALAEQLIKTFDTESSGVQTDVRIVRLDKAQASTLADAVQKAIAAGSDRPWWARRGQEEDESKVTITAETNSNSLLVRGPTNRIEPVIEMIRKLDTDSRSGEAAVRVFPLENSEAADLAKSLGTLFRDIIRQQSRGRRGQPAPAFSVTADTRTNSLVVSTTPGHFALVEELLKNLDKAPQRAEMDAEYIWLENADAFDVSMKLQELYTTRRGPDKPIITADFYANALTIIAKESDIKSMEPIIAKLDEAARDNNVQVRVLPITKMQAGRMAEVIRRVYGEMTASKIIVTDSENKSSTTQPAPIRLEIPGSKSFFTPGQATGALAAAAEATTRPATAAADGKLFGESPPPVTIAVDKRSNSLIISATRRELENIESLIYRLAESAAEGEAEFRVYKVQHTDPTSVARTLDALFNPRQPQRAQPQQNQRTAQQNQRGRGQQQPQQQVAAPKPVITVVADQRTRSVIVRAKTMDFEVIESIIKQLDTVATQVNEVRVFPLKNADATELARNISDLFRLTASAGAAPAGRQRGGRTPTQQRADFVQQMIELRLAEGDAQVDASSLLSITANRQANSVVVVAPADGMGVIASLIEELDQSAADASTATVRMYPLKNADVQATAAALQTLYPSRGATQRGRGQATGVTEQPIIITANEPSRTILVSAAVDDHERIAGTIAEMDAAEAGGEMAVKVYKVRHADAQSVATALTAAMDTGATAGRRGQPRASGSAMRITADRSGNSLVVRASAEDHKRIAELVEQLDVAPAEKYPVQMITLNHATPSEVARVLTRVFGGSARGRNATAQVVIEASDDSRMVMVRSDEETFTKIRALAAQLDTAAPEGKAARTVLALRHAKASAVAPALSQAFAPPRGQRVSTDELVTIVPEVTSNSLIVTANAANLQKVRDLLAKLDAEGAGGVRTEFILLKNARATELAGVLEKMVGGQRGARRGAGDAEVKIAADAGSNAIIMSGPAADLNELMQMTVALDQKSEANASDVRVIKLTNGDATEVAAMIRNLYNQQVTAARQARQTVEPLAVSADARANAVIVASGKDMYDRVLGWVSEVEKMKPARGTLRVITIQNADPAEVQKAIDQLFGGGSSSTTNQRGRRNPGNSTPASGGGKVETTLLPNQRAVMVSASDEDFKTVQQLVEALDVAAETVKREVKVFELANATNTLVAAALNNMYRQVARRGRPEDQVSVTALQQTNAVVVAATKDKLVEVAHLIAQLDSKEVAPKIEFRIYPLENAQPERILGSLRQMLQQIQRTRPGEPINVQADQRTRSIIVTARGDVFDEVGKIIGLLDKAPAHEKAEVLIIPLKKADAAQLSAVLNEMLRPSAANQATPEARALQEQVRLLNVRSALAEPLPELDLTKPIKIQADPARPQGSNALIITSTPDNLRAMQAIVGVLDTVPLAEGVMVRLLHLTNADAQSVMQVLRQVFDQGRQLAGRQGTSVQGQAEPETATGKALTNVLGIAADMRTNTLVLSGLEESLALAELVVKDLDRQTGRFVTEVKAFKLKNADAARLAPILRSVFAEGGATPQAEGVRTYITRLRASQDKRREQESVLPKVRAALTIQPDASTNILLVAARGDVMPLITDVIKTMDIPGAGSMNTVRIFPLTNADATRLSGVIDKLYAGPNARLVRDEDRPTVAVDTRTNSLVVSASDKTFLMLDALLKNLDAKTAIDVRDIRLLPLANAEAAGLAATLQKMMDARVQRQQSLGVKDAEALRVLIFADERSNSLIVGGSAESFQLVEDLAGSLDSAAPALGGQIQLIPLEEANAGTLAATLANLFNQRYQAARTPEIRRQKPIILPDLRVNALLVAANADDSKVLASLLKKLDVKLTDPAVRLVVIPMKHNDAGVVGPMIQRLFAARLASMTPEGARPSPQDKVDVAADALSNALVISASKENLSLIDGLLKKVDVEPPDESGLVKIYILDRADASRMAGLLGGLLAKGLYKPGMSVADSRALQAREKVAIASDIRTNALIVSASKENLGVIDEIVKRLDKETSTLLGDIRVYPLQSADAVRLGQMLQDFFTRKRQAELQVNQEVKIVPVVVIPDARTNTLLVAGGRENFDAVEAMIRQLDTAQVADATNFRVFLLKSATAKGIQPMLQQLFNQRVTRGQTKDPVTILADERSNTLVVGATAEDMKLAESLIAKLDVQPDETGRNQQVFMLSKADATQVANTLRELFKGQGGQDAVTISVDERTNSIIVSAGTADLQRAVELVESFDRAEVTRITEIRVFTLINASADELAKILTDALTNKPKAMTARSPNLQTWLQFVTRTKDGEELITSALQEGVLITPDPRTNSLVVSAPKDNMPLLARMIEAMDFTAPRVAEIRVFELTNADATQMATILRNLFRMQATGGGAASEKAVQYRLAATTQPSGAVEATVGSAEQDALNITVDPRTNSLLIGGTSQYVQMCSNVIEQLDASPARERMSKVYRLRNAQATDIEQALRSFLDQERQRLVSTLGADSVGAAQRLLEREVAIVAVGTEGATENSNTLLLSASPRFFETIEGMIKELDQPPPQVLIQVLLAEVTLSDKTDLGVEWNVDKTYNGTRAQYGTSFGVQGEIGKLNSFSVSVTGGDLNFYLRALQAQNKLEILSRPQILASDNQKANINVGQRVPFITNSRVTEGGTTLNTIQYQPVGIILDVTPRINPDGFVKLQVRPEISSLSSSTVDISEGVKATIVNERKAETTVTVQDGHTVVLGGLITTQDENIEDKVPILGDIPFVGNLFKSTKVIKERKELLIILTPRVLRTMKEADGETSEQLKRLNAQRALVKEQVQDELLEVIKRMQKSNRDDLGDWEHIVPKPEEDGMPLRMLPDTQDADRPKGEPATRPAEEVEYQ